MEYIYFVHDGDELRYVGLTHDLAQRVYVHQRGKYGNGEVFTVARLEEIIDMYKLDVDMGLAEVEGLMIALHQPTDNKQGPDLVASHSWPPTYRDESPRAVRARDLIKQLKAYRHKEYANLLWGDGPTKDFDKEVDCMIYAIGLEVVDET